MSTNSPAQELNNLLITKNFEINALDASTGKSPVGDNGSVDISAADMFSFDYETDAGKNYGTVVIVIDGENNLTMYFGDNLGRSMESEDKKDWYDFLHQIRQFAKRNLLQFNLQNINRLKYTMQGIAALKEGLFESYTGTRRVSYSGQPTEARLMIRHNRNLGESDARFRYIESLFIETADGERFRLPFTKLAGGRAMLEHVRQGGRPYDQRGQHITQIVEQISVLGRFNRAHQRKIFEGEAQELIAETEQYYSQLRKNLKTLESSSGYSRYFESWNPADITEQELVVEDIKTLFVEQTIDPRILEALPILARIKETSSMKESEIFESWAEHMIEGINTMPDTPEKLQQLKDFFSTEQQLGADATNIIEQLSDVLSSDSLFDMLQNAASRDPAADARPVVTSWINSLAETDPAVDQLRGELDTAVSEEIVAQQPDAAVTDPDVDQLDEVLPALGAAALGNLAAGAGLGALGQTAVRAVGAAAGQEIEKKISDTFTEDELAKIKNLALPK
jgi:hypothetical protein